MKKVLYGKEAMDYLVRELVERKLTDEEANVSVTVEEANFFDDFYEENEEIWDEFTHDPECIEFSEVAIEKKIEELKDDYDDDMVDEDELRYDARHELEEGLGYWTVYFTPVTANVEVALRVGLIPFWYECEFYLALGGCGMDLSPRQVWYWSTTPP